MLKRYYSKVANQETALQHLFAYGLLKRNEPNHDFLTNDKNGYSKYIETGETITKYPLIVFTTFNLPCLIKTPGKGFNVQGEVYQVDDRMLKNLDKLWDHPDFFMRYPELVKLTGLERNNNVLLVRCWVYFFLLRNTKLFYRELLRSYDSKEHVHKPPKWKI